MVFRNLAMAFVATLGATTLQAQGSMSSLPAGSFGGTGIPTESVVVSNTGSGALILGLSAHTRCQSLSLSYATCDMPGPVTNDGNRTFFALAGGNSIVPDPGSAVASGNLARWNFAVFVGGTNVNAHNYLLRYDFNPLAGNLPAQSLPFFTKVPIGSSQNLGFSYLDLNGPTAPNFNPAAPGEHAFRLEAYDFENNLVAHSAMNVVTSVPEPSSYALVAAGLGAMALLRRRRKA